MPNDDYIKKADAVFAVQKRIEQIGMGNNPHVCSIRQAVRDAPAADVEPKRKWIPVTERLPEYPGRFMCVYEVEEYGEVGHCIDWGRYDPDDGWYVSGVTHWMPLPEPPKEEDNE